MNERFWFAICVLAAMFVLSLNSGERFDDSQTLRGQKKEPTTYTLGDRVVDFQALSKNYVKTLSSSDKTIFNKFVAPMIASDAARIAIVNDLATADDSTKSSVAKIQRNMQSWIGSNLSTLKKCNPKLWFGDAATQWSERVSDNGTATKRCPPGTLDTGCAKNKQCLVVNDPIATTTPIGVSLGASLMGASLMGASPAAPVTPIGVSLGASSAVPVTPIVLR